MDKKLLPDDLFGSPPSGKPASVKQGPAKDKEKPKPVAKTAAKTGKIIEKRAVSKPKPAQKPKKTAAKPPAEHAHVSASRKSPQRKGKPAAKKATAPVSPPPPIEEAPAAAQDGGDADRRKIIEQFRMAREKERSFSEEPEKVEMPRPASPLEKMIEADEPVYEKCPLCDNPLPENAHVCPRCYVPLMQCPYCGRRAGAIENPKMATEQRFNRILKQFTLFSLALPSMPIQPILDCSACKSRVIICESCHEALKYTAQACPACGNVVNRTKLLINPLTILEAILRRPDALRGLQRLIEVLISSASR